MHTRFAFFFNNRCLFINEFIQKTVIEGVLTCQTVVRGVGNIIVNKDHVKELHWYLITY